MSVSKGHAAQASATANKDVVIDYPAFYEVLRLGLNSDFALCLRILDMFEEVADNALSQLRQIDQTHLIFLNAPRLLTQLQENAEVLGARSIEAVASELREEILHAKSHIPDYLLHRYNAALQREIDSFRCQSLMVLALEQDAQRYIAA